MSIFCGRKWRRGDSRPRRRPTRSRPLPHIFSSPVSSFAINPRRGISQLPLQSPILVPILVYVPPKQVLIPLSDEEGLWDKIKKVKTKRQVCPWKMGKTHGNQNRLAELHGSTLSGLDPKIVQDSRGFQVQLRIIRYTVQCTLRWSTGRTLVERASLGKMHGRHYFSPQQNGAKNHWIAWQCTFKHIL